MAEPAHETSRLLVVLGIAVGLVGLAIGAGGAWLAAVGGSWYYLVAGVTKPTA